MNLSKSIRRRIERAFISLGFVAVWSWAWAPSVLAAVTAPTVPISQTPMTVTIPAHPQIMIAVANSQSVDGNLSGAIMTGSGMFGGAYADLYNSSSPQNYTIPGGFTPPVNLGNGVTAPYTVNAGPYLVDNSASRLNVAKGGITEVLNTYIADADFGLMDFETWGVNGYTTWVYQMSQPGGFTFTSLLGATVPGVTEYVPNPCYHANMGPGNPVQNDCQQLHAYYGFGAHVYSSEYMVVSASSDDPVVNDVLYAGNGQIDPVCITLGGPNPPTPFPPNDYLANYVAGGVGEGYWTNLANCGAVQGTGPTNAGFVPYSAQVMYEERGFGFYGGQSSNSGNVLVPIGPSTSAGATPTPASVAAALANFTPYLAPETSVTWTGEIKAAAIQSPIAGLIASAQSFFSTNPASSNGCAAQKYVVLVTDGLPTEDLNGGLWPPAGSTSALMYGMTSNFLADGSLDFANTNDQALKDAITNLQNLAANGIKTYVIGVGAGVDPSVNPTAAATLQAMAIAGGTGTPNAAAPMGYFPANSPAAVTADLQVIITKILAATQSVASAAVNSTGLNTNSVVYQSQFLTSDTFQDWDGNLFAFAIASDGKVDTTASTALWSAATQLQAQNWDTGRFIATWDPTLNAGIPFRWHGHQGIGHDAILGPELTTFAPDTHGSDVLNFLRGDNSLEVPPNGSGQFRDRTHRLGDIVSSDPLYVGAPSAANQTPSYVTFAAANAARRPVIYVGANDGMLHAFDATDSALAAPSPFAGSTTGGNELFAYIPRGVFANLVNLVNPYYNAVHQYFVNGSPQASDVQFADSSWHTVLVGTEGAGGNSVFALDVTSPDSITGSEAAVASAVLWDFIDPDMGLGFSTPAIASTRVGWTVFVGNGYNTPTQKPFLFALNAQSGATVSKIDLCAAVPTACNLAASNGLSTVIAVNSGGQLAGYANIVYAGDLQGNLWRVDVSNANPALWTVTVLFQARDPLGNPQPITNSPVASLNPRYPQILGTMVFFATGELLGLQDLANRNVQTIYGIYDPPATYATPLTSPVPRPLPGPPPGGPLIQQTLSVSTSNGQVVVDTSNTVSIPTNKGWYVDLTLNSGERIITDPRLESGGVLVLTSYVPSIDPCSAGGSSYLYMINYATGGSFASPQFDLNGDHVINSSDTVLNNGQQVSPVGLSLGNVFAAAATIRTANLGSIGAIKLITESNDTIQSVGEKGSSKNRTAWWEIRK
jgi:type IV pilus assembly protein PilY1